MTINDIARMAGVSKGTVSRVINHNPQGVSEQTRQRILYLIEEVGYIPNRVAGSITLARTKTIGLIIPDIQNMFFPQMVRGVEDCAMENGYTLFLCNSDSNIHKEQQYLRAFLEKRVDGILVNTCGELEDRSLYRSVCQSGIPMVLLDRKSRDFTDKPGVYVDNQEAAYSGVTHLIDTGCRNILFLGGPKGVYTTGERLKGYRQALREAEIPFQKEYITYGAYSTASGYERVRHIIEAYPETDAIFAGADTIAIGVLRALRELNIPVPGQVSVLGFDNIMLSADLTPTLTTVAQPIYEMGYRAARKLLALIGGDPEGAKSECMSTTLVQRESTRSR